MHACGSVPIVMVLHLAALRAAGPLNTEHYKYKSPYCTIVSALELKYLLFFINCATFRCTCSKGDKCPISNMHPLANIDGLPWATESELVNHHGKLFTNYVHGGVHWAKRNQNIFRLHLTIN